MVFYYNGGWKSVSIFVKERVLGRYDEIVGFGAMLNCLRALGLVRGLGRSTSSGPVHGTLSVQRAEAVAHANWGSIRGGGKAEVEGLSCGLGKVERSGWSERELVNLKTGPKCVTCFDVGCRSRC